MKVKLGYTAWIEKEFELPKKFENFFKEMEVEKYYLNEDFINWIKEKTGKYYEEDIEVIDIK